MLPCVHVPVQVNTPHTPIPNTKKQHHAWNTVNTQQGHLLVGFHLNNQLTQSLTSRYRDSRLRVDFERFVCCAARLTCIFRECYSWQGGVWQGVPQGWCCILTLASHTYRPLLPTPGWRRGGRLPDPQTGELARGSIVDRVALAASQSLCLKAISSFSSVVGGGYLLIGLKLREATLLPCLVPVMEAEHGSKCLLKSPSHRWWLCLPSAL